MTEQELEGLFRAHLGRGAADPRDKWIRQIPTGALEWVTSLDERKWVAALVGGLSVEVIETSSLGDRRYLASDGEVAVVVDPQRDVDRVLAAAGRAGARPALLVDRGGEAVVPSA